MSKAQQVSLFLCPKLTVTKATQFPETIMLALSSRNEYDTVSGAIFMPAESWLHLARVLPALIVQLRKDTTGKNIDIDLCKERMKEKCPMRFGCPEMKELADALKVEP